MTHDVLEFSTDHLVLDLFAKEFDEVIQLILTVQWALVGDVEVSNPISQGSRQVQVPDRRVDLGQILLVFGGFIPQLSH